jgi:hypothetical protein
MWRASAHGRPTLLSPGQDTWIRSGITFWIMSQLLSIRRRLRLGCAFRLLSLCHGNMIVRSSSGLMIHFNLIKLLRRRVTSTAITNRLSLLAALQNFNLKLFLIRLNFKLKLLRAWLPEYSTSESVPPSLKNLNLEIDRRRNLPVNFKLNLKFRLRASEGSATVSSSINDHE